MEYDKEQFKVYTWKNWMMLHWIINPGLAVNELLLGQRVPKVTLEDKISDKPRIERSFVPCPHCNTYHDGRTWSIHNGTAFKNWFGLYCPNCGQIIPCLTNATSFIILILTYPVWGWFKSSLKENWLKKQPDRYRELSYESLPKPYQGKNWIKSGLLWGLFMLISMTLIFLLFEGKAITLGTILIGIPLWTIGGLGFGYFMKKYSMKRNASH
ncbi:hypothetical protein EZS27_013503 [termite gut metagenome]|uniref:Uncharacterized protein n=1 Tax=termite gut metagenome TaxID=433724 RepID=A0A5J4RXK8_9ZZZZ